MRATVRFTLTVSLLCTAALAGCAGGSRPTPTPQPRPVVLDRGGIAEILSERLVLGERPRFDLEPQEQDALLADVRRRLPVAAEEFLPETLRARSSAVIEAILPRHVIISENDDEHNSLMLNLLMREVWMRFTLAERIAPLTDERTRAMEENIVALTEGLRETITSNLTGIVDEQDTRLYLEAMQAAALDTLRDPVNPAFKCPVPEKNIHAIIAEVEKRIEVRRPEFEARIERAHAARDSESRPRIIASTRHSALVDLAPEPFKKLERQTTQPDLLDFEPGDFDPVFPFTLEKLREREKELYEIRLRDTSEGRR